MRMVYDTQIVFLHLMYDDKNTISISAVHFNPHCWVDPLCEGVQPPLQKKTASVNQHSRKQCYNPKKCSMKTKNTHVLPKKYGLPCFWPKKGGLPPFFCHFCSVIWPRKSWIPYKQLFYKSIY